MFFETLLINLDLAKICVSGLAVAPHGGPRGGKPEGLDFFKTVKLTGRATRAPPEDRSSAHVGYLDCQKLYGGELNLSLGSHYQYASVVFVV